MEPTCKRCWVEREPGTNVVRSVHGGFLFDEQPHTVPMAVHCSTNQRGVSNLTHPTRQLSGEYHAEGLTSFLPFTTAPYSSSKAQQAVWPLLAAISKGKSPFYKNICKVKRRPSHTHDGTKEQTNFPIAKTNEKQKFSGCMDSIGAELAPHVLEKRGSFFSAHLIFWHVLPQLEQQLQYVVMAVLGLGEGVSE